MPIVVLFASLVACAVAYANEGLTIRCKALSKQDIQALTGMTTGKDRAEARRILLRYKG